VAAVAADARASEVSGSAVEKVIQMLNVMSANSKRDKQEEEVAFAKFSTFCSLESQSFTKKIAKNDEELESLAGSIGKLTENIKGLGKSMEKLNNDVAEYEADKKTAAERRKEDYEAFQAESQDFAESVDALERAIEVLQKQDYDRPGTKSSLLELSQGQQLPGKARSIISAFVSMAAGGTDTDEEDADPSSYEAPEADAYEFQSGGAIEMLAKLRDDFRSKLATCRKEEMNSKHAYEMMALDLADSIDNAKREIEEKTAEKARKEEKVAEQHKQVEGITAVKASNQGSLKEMTTDCSEKKLSFEEKQKLRTEEIEALAKAVEILSSPEVAKTMQNTVVLTQRLPEAAALLQTGMRGPHRQVRIFLDAEAKRLHSQRLMLLAQKVAADPFLKVKKLIEDLITRLLEEANADAKQEGFCDTELGKSKITRNKLTEDIDGLKAAVDDTKATIMKLGDNIEELSGQVQEIVSAVKEATTMRYKEKDKNAATLKEAKMAQEAVAAATSVLKDFYAKAMTATALVQAPSPRQWGLKTGVKMGTQEWNALGNPGFQGSKDTGHIQGMQTFGPSYQGQQDQAEYGVLALLEVIQSDFAQLEAETRAAEEESRKAAKRFMSESEMNKAVKEKEIELNSADKAAAEERLQQDTADLKAVQRQLEAAERYHANLVPQCMDKGKTFEEREKEQKAEIASLKEALEILSSEDIETSAL